VEVFADPMLEKVFFNLFDNSIEHGERVSGIAISFCDDGGGQGLLVIEDDGVGIGNDEKEVIFHQSFGRNSGYGLFLVREILDLTGISIKETGREGQGARFEIRIPPGKWRVVEERPSPSSGTVPCSRDCRSTTPIRERGDRGSSPRASPSR
jgi:signal transduction histidine kinase